MAGRSKPRGKPAHPDWTPTPARGVTKTAPPFEEGNIAALVHGAQSPRTVDELAKELHDHLLATASWLDRPHYAGAVQRYLMAASRERLLMSHIARKAASGGLGSVGPAVWDACTSAARLADRLGADLGLTPVGEAKLRSLAAGAVVAETGLADLLEAGSRTKAARSLRAISPESGPEPPVSGPNATDVVRNGDGAA